MELSYRCKRYHFVPAADRCLRAIPVSSDAGQTFEWTSERVTYMRKMLMLLAMIASLGFAAAPVAMAQDDVDLGSISKTVQKADQGKLMTALETPPTDE